MRVATSNNDAHERTLFLRDATRRRLETRSKTVNRLQGRPSGDREPIVRRGDGREPMASALTARMTPLPRPRSTEVHLHALEFAPHAGLEASVMDWLSPPERARADRLRSAAIRDRFVLAHAYTRHVLGRYVGLQPRDVPLASTELGKPVIVSPDDSRTGPLAFSLAHCDTHTTVAVAGVPEVGVDVERWRPEIDVLAIARRYFAPAEVASLEALSPSQVGARFLQLWTCKEAFVKAIGLGLRHPLDRVVIEQHDQAQPQFASIAAEYGSPSEWSVRTWAVAAGCHGAVVVRVPARSLVAIHIGTALPDR
jgi:4'-phosphopantetheinyl transferase